MHIIIILYYIMDCTVYMHDNIIIILCAKFNGKHVLAASKRCMHDVSANVVGSMELPVSEKDLLYIY